MKFGYWKNTFVKHWQTNHENLLCAWVVRRTDGDQKFPLVFPNLSLFTTKICKFFTNLFMGLKFGVCESESHEFWNHLDGTIS